MQRTLRLPIFLVILLGLAHNGYADRAGVPFGRNAFLSVPRQQAIIAWNGNEEVLILGTDRRASREVKVLEVLPLPGEPTIWKPKKEVFDAARVLVAAKLGQGRRSRVAAKSVFAPQGFAAGQVTKHRKIGAHDIRVVHVKDDAEFVNWTTEHLRKWGAEVVDLPAPFRRVINTYIREGYTWFAFDIVELGPEVGSLEPVGYKFKSDGLYFPLRVTTLDQGDSSLELLILTDQQLARKDVIGQAQVNRQHSAVELSAAEQRKLDSHLSGLFPGKGTALLETWVATAKTAAFTEDLQVRAVAGR